MSQLIILWMCQQSSFLHNDLQIFAKSLSRMTTMVSIESLDTFNDVKARIQDNKQYVVWPSFMLMTHSLHVTVCSCHAWDYILYHTDAHWHGLQLFVETSVERWLSTMSRPTFGAFFPSPLYSLLDFASIINWFLTLFTAIYKWFSMCRYSWAHHVWLAPSNHQRHIQGSSCNMLHGSAITLRKPMVKQEQMQSWTILISSMSSFRIKMILHSLNYLWYFSALKLWLRSQDWGSFPKSSNNGPVMTQRHWWRLISIPV